MLFTDSLGDVNGVSRFIRNMADQAVAHGRFLDVVSSTNFPVPRPANFFNFSPVLAAKMPRYENLELVLPPVVKMLRFADERRPDVIHVSTPGTVGLVGLIAARMLRVPVVGVYHTDFPAYVERLFDDHSLGKAARLAMRLFYGPFRRIFTRSEDYSQSLASLGLPEQRLLRLRPGIEPSQFGREFRDDGLWRELERHDPQRLAGLGETGVAVLYVGRVSVEKGLPLLAPVWKRVCAMMAARPEAPPVRLVIVGDGPYRAQMEESLRGLGVYFLGFRYGAELARIYASSDLFAFPSTTDTLGQVVMEAQASGLPVLVTDQGGPREVVDNGRTGLVLSAADTGAWARAITDLACDQDCRRRMGAEGVAHMRRFDIAHCFDHFWDVHEEARREHAARVPLNRCGVPVRTGEDHDSTDPKTGQWHGASMLGAHERTA